MKGNSVIGFGGGPSMYTKLLGELLTEAAKHEATLTPEEKAERVRRRQEAAEKRRRKAQVLHNICPSCEGKLVRGKKDKRYGYQRLWQCQSGDHHYTSEGEMIELEGIQTKKNKMDLSSRL